MPVALLEPERHRQEPADDVRIGPRVLRHLFDKLQLEAVVQACSDCDSLSDAGRKLFAVSRMEKTKPNDADRLKKYLARHDLTWDDVRRQR